MRNLKKVMALALVFAMALTMMAGAAFTDEASIINKDAVNTVNALGIIAGYPDGSFQGGKTVTRAEMAKMIYVLRTGKESADIYKGSNVALNDVDGHWAEGFIKYCYTLGIVAGKGAGKFDPDAPVTGLEAAKMLLVVAGYKADKSGLEGTQWGVNTARLAAEAGLWEDYDVPFANNAPRDYAALLIFNALDINLVKWSNDAEDYDWVYKGTDAKVSVGEQFLGVKKAEGTLVTSGKASLVGRGSSKVLDIVDDETESTRRFTKVSDDYSNLLGEHVKVLYKTEDGKNVVYGVFASADEDNAEFVVASTLGEVELSFKSGSDDVKTITVGDVEVDWVKGESKAIIVGEGIESFDAALLKTPAAYANYMASPVKLVYNEDDEAVYAVIYPVVLDKVTFANSKEFGLKNAGVTVKLSDDSVYGDVTVNGTLKKNAWVLVSRDFAGDTNLEVVEKVEGKVGATRNSQKDVRIDGTWFTVADDGEVENNKTYEYFEFGQYIVEVEAADDDEVNMDEVLLVAKVGNNDEFNDDIVKAKVYFADGSNKIVEVDTDEGDDPVADTLFTFEVEDGYYVLTAIDTDDFDAKVTSDFKSNKFGSYKVDNGAVVFVKYDTSKYTVYTGDKVNDFSKNLTMTKCVAYVDEVNKLDRVVLAFAVSSDKPAEDGDFVYAYVPGDAEDYTVKEDDEDVTYFKVWNGSELVELFSTENSFKVSNFEGKLVKYEDLGDGEIENMTVVGHDVAIKTVVDDTVVFYGNATEWSTNDDTTVFFINGKDEEGVVDGEMDAAVAADADEYFLNAIVVYGTEDDDFDDDEIAVIVYAINSKLDGEPTIAAE